MFESYCICADEFVKKSLSTESFSPFLIYPTFHHRVGWFCDARDIGVLVSFPLHLGMKFWERYYFMRNVCLLLFTLLQVTPSHKENIQPTLISIITQLYHFFP
jgi:hypothetical protein